MKSLVSTEPEPAPSSSDSLRIGAHAGPWLVEHELGRGGMGIVYAVRHQQIGKRAALKVMHRRADAHEQIAKRMLLEAQVVNAIGHPNIVDVFDVGALPDGRPYIVMEQLAGRSLGGVSVDRDQALEILQQICDALIAAHAAGIVHRDLKPENIFLVERDGDRQLRVKLLDWGIARVVHTDQHHTLEGQLVGTPRYLAPEQARGEPVTLATDIYSLGIVAYELLLGAPPFDGSSAAEIMGQHLYKAPRPPRELWPEIPPSLERLLLAMLAKVPTQRPTARDVAEQLAAIARGETPAADDDEAPPPRRRGRWQIAVGAAAVLASIALVAIAKHSDAPSAPRAPAARPTPAVTRSTPPVASIANPVLEDCADPGVLRDGPRWYLACTGPRFPLYASTNLTSWQRVGTILPRHPDWADGDAWSPQLAHIGDRYVAYYTLRVAGGKNAIGVATAPSAAGPYEDQGAPLIAPREGASDPYVVALDGQRYLYYKHEGAQPTLWVQPLAGDGLHAAGAPREVLAATAAWERGNVEAPAVVRAGGHVLLFYSGSQYCDASYAIGVARGTSPLGPFEKLDHPLLASGPTWLAPGHIAITDGAGGEVYSLSHAYRASEGAPSCDDHVRTRNRHRHVRLDRIDLGGEWPRL